MRYFIVALLFFGGFLLKAQAPDVLLNSDYHHQVDRLDIKSPNGFTGVKPYNRADLVERVENEERAFEQKRESVQSIPQFTKSSKYLFIDNYLFQGDTANADLYLRKKPILKHFYRATPSLYHHQSGNFKLSVNPLLYFSGGLTGEVNRRKFLSSRGAEIYGSIDNKIGYYAMVTDNQMIVPDYVSEQIYGFGAVPGENLWKVYNTTGFDYFTAKGYFNFKPTKSVAVKFGYDKNFIGNGYRSMILSDYAGNYTHLRIDTKIWKIHYTNIFADLNADLVSDASNVPRDSPNPLPRKLLALHRLDWKIRKNLSLGLFESIIYGGDSLGQNTFNINYLNPIVFYRSIEGNVGSGQGNAMVGLDMKWNFLNHFSAYGQFVLDEFKLSRIREAQGWWANKFAGQLGIKYIDVANIENLDLQLEYNSARPFIYSHTTKRTSYSHYNQPLANPLGANFNEFIAIVRYQPTYRLFLTAKAFVMAQGRDLEGNNYGANIFLDNTTRVRLDNNGTSHTQLSGLLTRTNLIDLGASYMLSHNLFIDSNLLFRSSKNDVDGIKDVTFLSAGLRLNMAKRVHEF